MQLAFISKEDSLALCARQAPMPLNHPAHTYANAIDVSDHARSWAGYGLFWGLVLVLNMGPHWEQYSGLSELLITAGITTALQLLMAFIAIRYLAPLLLQRNSKVTFCCLLVLGAILVAEILICIRFYFLEPNFPRTYERFIRAIGDRTIWQRTVSAWALKYVLFSKVPLILYPTAILMAFTFYQKQKQTILLQQQKQRAELLALKNQLNPHFIFNTLNSLYTLTLKKSDKAPIVIERLAEILDYILYRSNEEQVSIRDEIKLLENYIALEKIRYGERVDLDFNYSVENQQAIAPLLLLSLVENAFKHGVKEAIDSAIVRIQLVAGEDSIVFKVENSKPKSIPENAKSSIGYQNLRRQLSILHPESHALKIIDLDTFYSVELTIKNSAKARQPLDGWSDSCSPTTA